MAQVLMDKEDSRILQELQYDFPISERPFEVTANKLHNSDAEAFERVQRIPDEGVIRRKGAGFDPNKLIFRSTLAAVSIGPEVVDRTAETIGKLPEVTYSYPRNNAFNIRFTIIAINEKRIEEIHEQIRACLYLDKSQILNLPEKRLFKPDARFSVSRRF